MLKRVFKHFKIHHSHTIDCNNDTSNSDPDSSIDEYIES